jgi:hypothetical protein
MQFAWGVTYCKTYYIVLPGLSNRIFAKSTYQELCFSRNTISEGLKTKIEAIIEIIASIFVIHLYSFPLEGKKSLN